jgi:glycosyltransferase 2 family protein
LTERRGGGGRAWARRVAFVALVGFAVWVLVANRAGIASALRELDAGAFAAALFVGFLTSGAALLVWRALLADFGHRLRVPDAARIFFVSQLGKYVPGSVWSILTQIELSRDHRIPKRTSVAVGVTVIAVSVTTGLSVGAVLLPFGAAETARRFWWILLVIPLLVAVLHPRVLGPILNGVLRLARREPLPRTPTGPGLARVVGLQLVVWTLFGLQAWLLLVGLGVPAGPALPVAIGGYALAYALGQMAVGLPAGAGVRDTALALALSTLVPAATALLVALLARVIATVVDLALAGAFAVRRRGPA